jgi:hypothetical protein
LNETFKVAPVIVPVGVVIFVEIKRLTDDEQFAVKSGVELLNVITGYAPGIPSNSSAPISGFVAPPLTEPAGPGLASLSKSTDVPEVAAEIPEDSNKLETPEVK